MRTGYRPGGHGTLHFDGRGTDVVHFDLIMTRNRFYLAASVRTPCAKFGNSFRPTSPVGCVVL
jgi:hypothetical protein